MRDKDTRSNTGDEGSLCAVDRMASDESCHYEIRLKGHLDARWVDWFDGLCISLEDDGVTRLVGPIVDQAALFRVLRKARDLALPLLAVTLVEAARAVPAGPGSWTSARRQCRGVPMPAPTSSCRHPRQTPNER